MRSALVIRLKNLFADPTAKVLRTVYRDLVKVDPKTKRAQLVIGSEPTTNSLLLAGPGPVIKRVTSLVERLDSAARKKTNPTKDVNKRLDKIDTLLATLANEVRSLKQQINSPKATSQVRNAELNVRKAEIELETARTNYDLIKQTRRNPDIRVLQKAKAAVLIAETEVAKAKVAYEEAGAILRLARLQSEAALYSAMEGDQGAIQERLRHS